MKLTTLFVLSLGAGSLLGQDLLKPLIVTASRSAKPTADTPYSSAYLDQSDIADDDRRTLPKALQYTPGVLVQQTAYGHGSPFIRGFTGRQNLLMVDGVRMNNSTFRGGPIQYWNTVDALSIDHIELIKSQGSVLYGSDAAGGTLNAFTKAADFRSEADGEMFQHGKVAYEYRANGEGSHIGRFESQTGIGGKFGLHLGLSLKDFGDIRDDAVGSMTGTGYPEQDFDLRADWAVDADSTLTFVTQYVNQDQVNRWHRTTANPGWTYGDHYAQPGKFAANIYDQERMLSYLRYSGSNPLVDALVQRWTATLSYQTTRDSEFQDRGTANSIRYQDIDLDTYGVDLTLESDTDNGTWVYGFDYYRDEADASGHRTRADGSDYRDFRPIADDSTYDLVGLFGQYIWRPADKWEITAGARYTYARAVLGSYIDSGSNLQYDESKNWSALVGSLRALYHIDEQWSVYGGISQAFRAPNLNDLSGNVTSKAGSSTAGSLEVDPEHFLTYELGARRISEDLAIEMSVFYTDISDQITDVPVTSGSTNAATQNAGEGYIYGVELEGVWNFAPQWSLRGFAAWQDGRSETPEYIGGPIETQPQTRLLPLTGSLALRWTDDSEKFWVQGRVFGACREDRISAADQLADNQRIPTGGTPGYLITSLNAGWQATDSLNLTCGVENLFDQDYRIHGSGQNEPGIMGVFGAEISW